MAGMFDDIVPVATPSTRTPSSSVGMFDDIMPQTEEERRKRLRAAETMATTQPSPAATTGMFDDIEPQALTPQELGRSYPEVTDLEHAQRLAADWTGQRGQAPTEPGIDWTTALQAAQRNLPSPADEPYAVPRLGPAAPAAAKPAVPQPEFPMSGQAGVLATDPRVNLYQPKPVVAGQPESETRTAHNWDDFKKALAYHPEKYIPIGGTVWQVKGIADVLGAFQRLERDRMAPQGAQAEGGPVLSPYGDHWEPYTRNTLGPEKPRQRLVTAAEQRNSDLQLVQRFDADRKKAAELNQSFGGVVGQILGEMPAYMAEIGLTGGVYTGARGAVERGATRLLAKEGEKGLVKAAERGVMRTAARKIPAWAVGGTAQGLALPHRTAQAYFQGRLPDNFQVDDQGNVAFQWPSENPATTFVKALGDTVIQTASEQAGGGLARAGKAAFARLPFAGKLMEKMFAGYAKLHPETTYDDFAQKVATRVGFNGVAGEIGEEYLGDSLEALTAVNDYGADAAEAQRTGNPNAKAGTLRRLEAALWQDVANTPAMAVSFAVPGAVRHAPGLLARAAGLGQVPEPERPANAPPYQNEPPQRVAANGGRIVPEGQLAVELPTENLPVIESELQQVTATRMANAPEGHRVVKPAAERIGSFYSKRIAEAWAKNRNLEGGYTLVREDGNWNVYTNPPTHIEPLPSDQPVPASGSTARTATIEAPMTTVGTPGGTLSKPEVNQLKALGYSLPEILDMQPEAARGLIAQGVQRGPAAEAISAEIPAVPGEGGAVPPASAPAAPAAEVAAPAEEGGKPEAQPLNRAGQPGIMGPVAEEKGVGREAQEPPTPERPGGTKDYWKMSAEEMLSFTPEEYTHLAMVQAAQRYGGDLFPAQQRNIRQKAIERHQEAYDWAKRTGVRVPEGTDAAYQQVMSPIQMADEEEPFEVFVREQWHKVRDDLQFRRWFGDWERDEGSRVTDEKGRPLIVYHGTEANFDRFSRKYLGSYETDNSFYPTGAQRSTRLGFWFSSNPEGYRNRGAEAVNIPAYLNLRNPREYNDTMELFSELEHIGAKSYLSDAKTEGVDGIIIHNDAEWGGTSYIVFDPKNIWRLPSFNPSPRSAGAGIPPTSKESLIVAAATPPSPVTAAPQEPQMAAKPTWSDAVQQGRRVTVRARTSLKGPPQTVTGEVVQTTKNTASIRQDDGQMVRVFAGGGVVDSVEAPPAEKAAVAPQGQAPRTAPMEVVLLFDELRANAIAYNKAKKADEKADLYARNKELSRELKARGYDTDYLKAVRSGKEPVPVGEGTTAAAPAETGTKVETAKPAEKPVIATVEGEVRAKLRNGEMAGVTYKSIFRPVGSTQAVIEIMGERFTIDNTERLTKQAGMRQAGGRGKSTLPGKTQRDVTAFFAQYPRLGAEDFAMQAKGDTAAPVAKGGGAEPTPAKPQSLAPKGQSVPAEESAKEPAQQPSAVSDDERKYAARPKSGTGQPHYLRQITGHTAMSRFLGTAKEVGTIDIGYTHTIPVYWDRGKLVRVSDIHPYSSPPLRFVHEVVPAEHGDLFHWEETNVARNVRRQLESKEGQTPKARRLLQPQNLSDFDASRDRVERRGGRTFVVDSRSERAPVEVQSDVADETVRANLAKLAPDQLGRMEIEVQQTPYLSPEGKQERLAMIAEIQGKATPAELATAKSVALDNEGLNPKVVPLVAALNKAGVGTVTSGDLYRDDVVYVDLDEKWADAARQADLPVGWSMIPGTAPATEAFAEGRAPEVPDQKMVWRLARRGGAVSQEEAKSVVDALTRTLVGQTATGASAEPKAQASLADTLAQAGLTVTKVTAKSGRDYWQATGKTFDHKDLLDKISAQIDKKVVKPSWKWENGKKAWFRSFFNGDPTEEIAKALQGLPAAPAAGGRAGTAATQEGQGSSESGAEALERERRRQEEDGRPVRDRVDRGRQSELLSEDTTRLISQGLEHHIPQAVIDEQLEDVALGITSLESGSRLFLLANEAGTGKTFTIGGLIRELQRRGNKKILCVTLSEDLVNQFKRDLADYGIEAVQFHTYAGIRGGHLDAKGAVVILDEAHKAKDMTSQQGKVAQDLMKQAKFTVLSSATPFENPVEAAYLNATGIFGSVGGHHEWAKMYGATVIKRKYHDYNTGRDVVEERLRWDGGQSHIADQIAARNWFRRKGAFTNRRKKLPLGTATTTFRRSPVAQEYVDLVDSITEAYRKAAAVAEFDNKEPVVRAMIAMHRVNTVKRILEAAKIDAGIQRGKELLAEGKQIVFFTETKAERTIGKFHRSGEPNGKLYAYPEIKTQTEAWARAAEAARRSRQKPPKRPFAEAIVYIARALHEAGVSYELPSVSDHLMTAFPDAAVYTGEVTAAKARRNLALWKEGKRRVLIATMAKGGTGLSLHDVTGTMPLRAQVGINLPWTATQIDQTSGRLARYGTARPVEIEWLFADNLGFERELARRVGGRMADMGAVVRGLKLDAADALQDFDFEDEFNAGAVQAHERADEAGIEAEQVDPVEEAYRTAANLEKSRNRSTGEFDYFETPYPLAVFMGRIAGVADGQRILEPSAGQGSLLKMMPQGDYETDAVEISQLRSEELRQKFPQANVVQSDFMAWQPAEDYDTILMNPPFSRKDGVGWQDIAHVMKAYGHLKEGGRLVAVMGEGPFFREQKQDTAFREWLEEVGAQVVKLPAGTFKQSGTMVKVRLVVIDQGAHPGRTDIELSDVDATTLREFEDNITPRIGVAEPSLAGDAKDAAAEAVSDLEQKADAAVEGEEVPVIETHFATQHQPGKETGIEIPKGEPIPARYAVAELSEIVPSHDVTTGNPVPNSQYGYPAALQPRNYVQGSAEFVKVVGFANEKKVGFYISTHPAADSGPPSVDPDGYVINGNGRIMSLQYAQAVLNDYAWYKQALVENAGQFGIDPAAIKAMDAPVLVRIVDMKADSKEAIAFARAGNVATTQAQSPIRTAASYDGMIDLELIDTLVLDDGTTFSDAVSSSKGRFFRTALRDALPESQKSTYFTDAVDLTDAGKELVRNMLMLKVLPVETLEKLSEERRGVKQALENSIPQLLKAKRDFPEMDIVTPMVEAVQFLARNSDVHDMKDVNDTVNQTGLFTGGGAFDKISPEGRMLIEFILRNSASPGVFRTKLKALLRDFTAGTGLFGGEIRDLPTMLAEDLGVKRVAGATFQKKAGPGKGDPALAAAIQKKDFDALKSLLAAKEGNEANRAQFTRETGVTLPDSVAGTENALGEWVGGQKPPTGFRPDPTQEGGAKGEGGFAGVAGRPGGVVAKPWLTENKVKSPDADLEEFFDRTNVPPSQRTLTGIKEWLVQGLRERFVYQGNMPSTKEAALAKDMVRTLPEQIRTMGDKALGDVEGVINNTGRQVQALDRAGLDLLRRKVFVQDLLREAEIDRKAAGDFDIDKLQAENGRLDALIAKVPSVEAAYQARQALWETVSEDLFRRGVINDEARNNRAYVRHFVLLYAKANHKGSARPKKLSEPYRAYKKQRKGFTGDISTDYLVVEIKALADIYRDNAVEDLATQIGEKYDKRRAYSRQAKSANFERLVGGPAVVDRIMWLRSAIRESGAGPKERKSWIEELTELDPTYPYRRRIAMHKARLEKTLGELPDDEEEGFFNVLSKIVRERPNDDDGLAARGIFKAIHEREQMIKDTLGAEYLTPERLAKADGYVEWWYKRPNLMFLANTITEAQMAMLTENAAKEAGEVLQIPRSALRQALVMGGKRQGMLIPEWLAAQLDNLPVNRRSNLIVESFTKPAIQFLKRWYLRVNPGRYNFRNQLGDTERLNAAGQTSALKYLPQAAKMLVRQQGEVSEKAKEYGAIGSSLWNEMNDPRTMQQFARFANLGTQQDFAAVVKAVFSAPLKLAGRVGQVEQDLTQFREDLLRAVVYLKTLDDIKAGRKLRHWAGNVSDVEEIAKTDPYRAAAKLSRETMVDYGAFTPWENDVLRNGLIPFYSFLKKNLTFWPRAFINAAKEGAEGETAAALAKAVALNVPAWVIRVLGIYALAWLWNHRDDEARKKEEHLAFWLRSQPHANIGDYTLWGDTALSDFSEWFGQEELSGILWRREAGLIDNRQAALEAAKRIAQAPVNKVYQGLQPFLKAPQTAVTGVKTYPNVFRPRIVAPAASAESLEAAILDLIGADAEKFYHAATGERKFQDTLYAYFAGWWGRPSDPETMVQQIQQLDAWTSLLEKSATTGRKAGQAKSGKEADWQEAQLRAKGLLTQDQLRKSREQISAQKRIKGLPEAALRKLRTEKTYQKFALDQSTGWRPRIPGVTPTKGDEELVAEINRELARRREAAGR